MITNFTSRRAYDPVNINLADDENCMIFGDGTRIALLKLLGSFSRDDYSAQGLSKEEAEALDIFWDVVR